MRLSSAGLVLATVFGLCGIPAATEAPTGPAPSADLARDAAPGRVSEFGILHVAEGVDVTYYACTACHSEMIVAQQGLSRQDWDEMLDWMVEEQGMSELEEPERTEILDYLASHYNEDRPNFPGR